LPQKSLFDVREAILRGPVTAIAFDQDDKQELSQGQLLFIDNQIDQSTGSVRLKTQFLNEDERLWPGEFVLIRTLVDTRKNALTIPSVALQRGPRDFTFGWSSPTTSRSRATLTRSPSTRTSRSSRKDSRLMNVSL
jgi:multidrug efflux pump subunit AcrA (membrane-fusion protein)